MGRALTSEKDITMNARQFIRTRTAIGNAILAAGLAATVTLATPAHAGLLGQGGGSLAGSLSRGGLDGMTSGQGRLEATRPELRRPAVADRAVQLRDRGTQAATGDERADDAAGRGRGALGSLSQRASSAGVGAQGEAAATGQATAGAMRPAERPAATAPAMPATPAMPAVPAMPTMGTTPATPAPAMTSPGATPATTPTAAPAATPGRAPAEASGSTRGTPATQASGRRGSVAADGDTQAQASRQGGNTQVQALGSARASAERGGN